MLTKNPIFIVPHWTNNLQKTKGGLKKTLVNLTNQTDSNCKILIIDDASPDPSVKEYLLAIKKKLTEKKIDVCFLKENRGPGFARNVGIDYAKENNHPIILFNDADDCSDLKRVEHVKRIFDNNEDVDVVYNNFIVIDELDNPVPYENLSQSILEIIRVNNTSPPTGNNMWLKMGLYYGYTNLTSATAVRTELAFRCKFPNKGVSEDYHAFLRYGSYGKKFFFLKDIITKYRIIQVHSGSSSSREKSSDFYYEKVKTDNHGFILALKNAMINNKRLEPLEIMKRFNMRSCTTALLENRLDLANMLLRRANKYHEKHLLKK
jgi:glycosyltransferase involved in cell wall biosynthesis